jgi:hypothetical protein
MWTHHLNCGSLDQTQVRRENREIQKEMTDLFTSKKNFFLILESKHKKRLDHAG